MTHTTDQERAEFEKAWRERPIYMGGVHQKEVAYIWWTQAARRAPAVPVPQIDPVHGDCLPPIGSRVFIRHGRDDDAHACIVTGYYAWGDLNGSKHLHRVFVHLVYEGADTKQARMLCDCYATAEEALAAAPQPPEADHIPDTGKMVAAPVELPDPVAFALEWTFNGEERGMRLYDDETHCRFDAESDGGVCQPLYTEQQVRQLLADQAAKEKP